MLSFSKIIGSTKFGLVLILALSFFATWPLLENRFYSIHDELHVAWLYQIDRAMASGQIPPRWAPDLSFNFGYPLFNFVFPLPFYFGELIHLLGFSFVTTLKILFLLSIPLSGITIFLLVKRLTNSLAALTASIVYMFAPFRAVDIYVRGAIGEAIAFIFIPLVFWATVKTIEEKNLKSLGIGGISIAALILSHNIASYMTIPFLILFGLIYSAVQKEILKSVIYFAIGSFLGGLISIYFWLPAAVESKYMVANTVFDYREHFPFIKQLAIPSWGYGASVWGENDGLSFQIGVVNLIVTILAISAGFLNWNKMEAKIKSVFIFTVIALGISVFMMNIRSLFIWQSIWILPYFQFPWRFLILTTFFTSLSAGIFVFLISPKFRAVAVLVITVLTIFLTWNYFKPGDPRPLDDNYYLRRYTPNRLIEGVAPTVSADYQSNTEEYLRLPKATQVRPDKLFDKVSLLSWKTSYSLKEKSAIDFVIETEGKAAKFSINNYYFPGWKATLDNKKTDIQVGKPYGQIEVLVPEGKHILRVYFSETNFRSITNLISLFSLVFAIFLIFSKVKTSLPANRS